MVHNFMQEAIAEAYLGIRAAEGGPFGAVLVRNGEIVGRGHNRVISMRDPTRHAEMEAIRDACRNLNTHDLSGCTLIVTAEPCPMCLAAALWAGIEKIYFGCTREDTAQIGFRDADFYEHFTGKKKLLQTEITERNRCQKLFQDYVQIGGLRY